MGRVALAVFVVIASAVSSARAQESDTATPAEPKPTIQEQVMLRGRNRALLHPSDPLKIGGREQDGNDMRSGTTALQRGKTAAAGVNGDETYERAIAMVEGRAVYSTPPKRAPLADAAVASSNRKPHTNRPRKSAVVDEPSSSSNMPWALGGLGAAALAVFTWLFFRSRS